MIIKTFNNGWGPDIPLKQFELELTDRLFARIANDSSLTVVINSVWYSNEYHQQVLAELRQMDFNRIVIVAMLDPAIPHLDWYKEFNCEVLGVGYYPGRYNVDFFALFVDRYMQQYNTADLLNADLIDTPYMCLNRKPHWHRQRLYKQLVEQGIADLGFVSMGGNGHAIQSLNVDTEHDNYAPNATRAQHGIPNDIASVGDFGNWQRHLVNVVTETTFGINVSNFVSEKIFKPIVGCRPFLVYDSDGATQWLTQRGFETYVNDFSDITDMDLSNPNAMTPFLKVLCAQPRAYWQKKLVDLKSKMLYNKVHFAEYVQRQKFIVNKGI